jgi:aminopeptidase N
MLVLTEAEQSFVFSNVSEAPVPSLLRTFSAPVVLEHEFSDADLLTLLAHDSDPFNQWEASQRLGLRYALKAIAASGEASAEILPADFIEAMRRVLRDDKLDAAFKDLVLTLPSESYIAEQLAEVDPQRVHAVREAMILQLATALQPEWESLWEANRDTGAYRPDHVSAGRRALAGRALSMLCLHAAQTGDTVWPGKAYQRCKDAGNMTDRMAALSALVYSASPLAEQALQRFHALFKQDALVLDKWFALQVLPATAAAMCFRPSRR